MNNSNKIWLYFITFICTFTFFIQTQAFYVETYELPTFKNEVTPPSIFQEEITANPEIEIEKTEDLFSFTFNIPESMVNELPYISDDTKNYIKNLQFKVIPKSETGKTQKNIITGTVYQKNPDYKKNDPKSKKYTQMTKNNGSPLKMEFISIETKKDKTEIIFLIDLLDDWTPSIFIPKFGEFNGVTFKNSILIISTYAYTDEETGYAIDPGANVLTTVALNQLMEPSLYNTITKFGASITKDVVVKLVINENPFFKGIISLQDIHAPTMNIAELFKTASIAAESTDSGTASVTKSQEATIESILGNPIIKNQNINFEIGLNKKGQKLEINSTVNFFGKTDLLMQCTLERKAKNKRATATCDFSASQETIKRRETEANKSKAAENISSQSTKADTNKTNTSENSETNVAQSKSKQTEKQKASADIKTEIEHTATLSIKMEQWNIAGTVPGFGTTFNIPVHEPSLVYSTHDYESRGLKKGFNMQAYVTLNDLDAAGTNTPQPDSIITKFQRIAGKFVDRLEINIALSGAQSLGASQETQSTTIGAENTQQSHLALTAHGESQTAGGSTTMQLTAGSTTGAGASTNTQLTAGSTTNADTAYQLASTRGKNKTDTKKPTEQQADFFNMLLKELEKITAQKMETLLTNELEKRIAQQPEVQAIKNTLRDIKASFRNTQLTFSIPVADNATVALHPDLINVDTLSIPDSFKNLLRNCVVQNPQLAIDVSAFAQRGVMHGNIIVNNRCVQITILMQRDTATGTLQASMTLKIPGDISDTFTELLVPGITMENGILIFSNFNYRDTENNLNVDAGLTVVAAANLSGDFFAPIKALFGEKNKESVETAGEKSAEISNAAQEKATTQKSKEPVETVGEKPTKKDEKEGGAIKLKAVIKKDIKQSTFEAALPGQAALSFANIPGAQKIIEQLTIGSPVLSITPGTQKFTGAVTVKLKLPDQQLPVEMTGTIGAQPGATIVGLQLQNFNVLFLTLHQAGLTIGITPLGMPTMIEAYGKIELDHKPVECELKVGADGNALTAHAQELSLSTIVDLFNKMTGRAIDITKVPELRLTDAHIHLVPIETTIAGKTVPRGGTIEGKINILGVEGELLCELTMSGIKCCGKLAKFELSAFDKAYFKIDNTGKNKERDIAQACLQTTYDGPTIEIRLNLAEPQNSIILIDGLIAIPILAISDEAFIEVSSRGAHFHIARRIGDLFGMDVDAKAERGNIKNAFFTVQFQQDFVHVVRDKLPEALTLFQKHIYNLHENMVKSINNMQSQMKFFANQAQGTINTEIGRVSNAIENTNKRMNDKHLECTQAETETWAQSFYVCSKVAIESIAILAELTRLQAYQKLLLGPTSLAITAGTMTADITNRIKNTIMSNIGKLETLSSNALQTMNKMGPVIGAAANSATTIVNVNQIEFHTNMTDLSTGKLPKVTVTGWVFGKEFAVPMQIDLKKPIDMIHELVTGLVRSTVSRIFTQTEEKIFIPSQEGELYPEQPTKEFEKILSDEEKALEKITPNASVNYNTTPVFTMQSLYS